MTFNAHRNAGPNAWAFWKRNGLLGLAGVTDLWIADATSFHFSPDSAHVDLWLPSKGSHTWAKDPSAASNQYNASGWPNGQSYLGACLWRCDAIATALAGSVPFAIAYEFEPTLCPLNSVLFWLNAGTSSRASHALRYTGTAGNMQCLRDDGTTTKLLPSTVPITLSAQHVVMHIFDGVRGWSLIDGAYVDAGGDMFVGPISFTHCLISAAFTTALSNGSTNQCRTIAMGIGASAVASWLDEVPLINTQMKSSAGI